MKKALFIGCLLVVFAVQISFAQADFNTELKAVISQYVKAKMGFISEEVEVIIKNSGIKTSDITGDVQELKVIDIKYNKRPLGNVVLPVEIISNNISKKYFVRAYVEVLKQVVVAKDLIKRGEIIGPDRVETCERDVSMLPQKYFNNIEAVINQESATIIPKGSVVYEWMVKETPLIRQGEEVMIYVVGDGLVLKVKGLVLEDGYLGKKINVRAKESKKMMEGELISSFEVEVKL